MTVVIDRAGMRALVVVRARAVARVRAVVVVGVVHKYICMAHI